MPLVNVPLTVRPAAVPRDVRVFLHEAERRIERFQQSVRAPAFVSSDYAGAYVFLRGLAESAVAPGGRFCEWGSGFGVVTCLAALIGFDACGIEIEAELVDEARRLADDFDIAAEFVRGSFIPPGGEAVLGDRTFSWLTAAGEDTSAELGLHPAEVDVVYAYPWPDEERAVPDLFEQYAGAGAVLVTYHSGDEFRLRRKTAGRRR